MPELFLGTFHGFEGAQAALTRRLGYQALTGEGSGDSWVQMSRDDREGILNIWPMPDVAPLPLFFDQCVYGASLSAGSYDKGWVAKIRKTLFDSEGLDAKLKRLNPECGRVPPGLLDTSERPRVLLILREHLLLEKINIIDGFLRAGLRMDEILFVSKEDQSLYRERVRRSLHRRSVRLASSISETCSILRQRRPLPLVVIDDGGDLARVLHDEDLLPRGSRIAETTSKGAALLASQTPPIPFVDLAHSPLKRDMSRGIAASCVFRLRQILKHEKLEGQKCLILGYGEIGRQTAHLLGQIGLQVHVCDTDMQRAAIATEDGFPTVTSAAQALGSAEYALVMGCTGQTGLRLNDCAASRQQRMFLAAVSSNDFKALRLDLESAGFAHKKAPWYGTLYTKADAPCFHLLADGGSINLFRDEGVSEPEFDPFNAHILHTGLELAASVIAEAAPLTTPCVRCPGGCSSLAVPRAAAAPVRGVSK